MNKRKVIVIGGQLGAGKTSTATGVSEKLGYGHFGGGIMHRKFAEELGLDYVTEYLEKLKTDTTFDNKVDEFQREYMATHDQVVADGHAAYFLAPFAFKVYLDLDRYVAAERIFSDAKDNPKRTIEKNWNSVEDVYTHTKLRQEKDLVRFRSLFGESFNHLDKNNFDLVINTSEHDLQEVTDMIIAKYQQWLSETE
ncbi:MAG: cytidylate kinase [Planctomycetota bacterium]|jgi:cytidylate kinase